LQKFEAFGQISQASLLFCFPIASTSNTIPFVRPFPPPSAAVVAMAVPKLVVFDLDACCWYPEMYMLRRGDTGEGMLARWFNMIQQTINFISMGYIHYNPFAW
jgi:hypothetical protein